MSRLIAILVLPSLVALGGCVALDLGGEEQPVIAEGPAQRVPAEEPGDSPEEKERKRAAREAATEDYWREREAWRGQGGF